MVKKKRKKKVKKKPSQNIFAGGGLILLIIGGFFGILYQTLYLLITREALADQSLSFVGARVLQELGFLLVFCALMVGCYYYRIEEELHQKITGFTLIPAAAVSIPAFVYLLYDNISILQDQVFTMRTFLTQTIPILFESMSKIYFFAGAFFLGILFIGILRRKSVADWFLISGSLTGCVVLVIYLYKIIDSYSVYLEQGASSDLIMARVIIPSSTMVLAYLFIIGGTLLFSISRIWKRRNLKPWTGRIWLVGGITGAFHEFIQLAMNSQNIQDEILRVRQYIMELTPYSTSLRDLPLTTLTLREYYVKKMIPLYLDHALWILIFSGLAMVGLYFWMKK